MVVSRGTMSPPESYLALEESDFDDQQHYLAPSQETDFHLSLPQLKKRENLSPNVLVTLDVADQEASTYRPEHFEVQETAKQDHFEAHFEKN